MTLYLKHPGQEDGGPVGAEGEYDDSGGHGAERDEWALYLPHQCQAWDIGYGSRESVIEDARAFRAELDTAITMLEQAAEADQ